MNIIPAKRMDLYEEGIFQLLNEQIVTRLEAGQPVYNLSVGTPDFPPPNEVIQAVVEAAKDPEHYKYALRDLPELLTTLQKYYWNRYGVSLEPTQIMSLYGSQEGIAHIGLSLLDEGDGILIPNPGYPIFTFGPLLANATLYEYELTAQNNYLPDLDGIPADILNKTKAMIVSYPLNPISKIAPRSFYEKLIPWALEHEILILHDNAYSDIVYDGRVGESILSIERAMECCVEFYSLSKTYNYTGARMSFLVGNEKVIGNFQKLRSQIDYGIFLPVQYGAIAALNTPQDVVVAQCKQYEERRDTLCNGLRKIGWHIEDSQGTMFAWAKIPSPYEDDLSFVMELMKRSGVVCTPGSSFGSLGKGYVRFALNKPCNVIREAIQAIDQCGILTN